jgi:hypothetical protein
MTIKTANLRTNNGRGTIQKRQFGAICCTRYVGDFSVPALQSKADMGMWYTTVMGNPFAVQGEGATLEAAVRDAIDRTISMRTCLDSAVRALEHGLTVCDD